MKYLYLTLIFWGLSLSAKANCPGCTVNLPALPEDTIYISAATDGQVGQYYVEDLSFRLPQTTTPVNATDPDTPPGLPISEMTISSVANVPPGLQWEANQLSFDVSENTDGCVRFCGTPLIPGLYEVEVIISAQVLVATQTSAVTIPILILPGQAVSEGFTIDNTSGCGEVVANFTNNVPSNGTDGFNYIWDFGNGNSSEAENPAAQVYDAPGQYGVSYQVIVDTFGHQLTEVVVTDVDCNDLFGGAPDLVLEVYNPLGVKVFASDVVQNANLPVVFNPGTFIEDGPYQIRVIDDDQGLDGGDDVCGVFGFVKTSNGELEDDGATVEINIIHPVDTIRSEGLVTVFEQPEQPELQGYDGEMLCEGDSLTLLTNYTENTQWYQDTVPLLGANGDLLPVGESGFYWVTYTNADGCSATSDTVLLDFNELPEFPVFQNDQNLLFLVAPEALPEPYELQWFLNEQALEGADGLEYCISVSGSYTLEVVNPLTGCSRTYTQSMVYDPAFPNCMPVGVAEAALEGWKVYPTLVAPGAPVWIADDGQSGPVEVRLLNTLGQQLQSWSFEAGLNGKATRLLLPQTAAGVHYFWVQTREGSSSFPIVIQGRL
ncbi:MAG: hypothetical protein RIC19_05455 [Phaeodactylibacter sp.]|uniref:PKD domain-containing protein n=1 Tax=Phaeodactylibacter sp. TaxID=1940289 RepID=UPI0032EB4E1B